MKRVTLATWNVHAWIGRDAKRNPERCFECIQSLDVDIVALQETQGDDWHAMARACGFATVVPPETTICARPYGNALLLRGEAKEIRYHSLSVLGREPRDAIEVECETAFGPLRVLTTHLGLGIRERRAQAKRLARLFRDPSDTDIALLGDLNDWTRSGRHVAPLARVFGPLSRLATFPARRPIFPLDRIAIRTTWASSRRIGVVRTEQVRSASDHLPLRAEIEDGSRMG